MANTPHTAFRLDSLTKRRIARIAEINHTDMTGVIKMMAKEITRNEIIDRLGADDWEMVQATYEGLSMTGVTDSLFEMWPAEEEANNELAQMIYDELN